eukprot:scaffold540946_cov41-Prasinocladus_malaysianus.AAC.1
MPLEVTSGSSFNGSAAGGTLITITGQNFPEADPSLATLYFQFDDFNITIDDCEVERDSITFRSPVVSNATDDVVNATLTVGGESFDFILNYQMSLTPTISSVSPALVSAVEPTLLTITGTMLGDSADDAEITLAGD